MEPQFDLDSIFSYHAATPEQIEKYQKIRDAGKAFASTVIENTRASTDQYAAVNLVREAVMLANAAIALEGRIFKV